MAKRSVEYHVLLDTDVVFSGSRKQCDRVFMIVSYVLKRLEVDEYHIVSVAYCPN